MSFTPGLGRDREVLDGAYYSCDIGVAKPSAGFFEHIVTDLGLAPSQLLFLDDQPDNVAGARSAGLPTSLADLPA